MGYYLLLVLILFFGGALLSMAQSQPLPPLQLATEYRAPDSMAGYWVSEKLDGVRAYWDGNSLRTRQGNIIQAPAWFTVSFPRQPLDGELWMGRGRFDRLSGIVRQQIPDEAGWRKVVYMVFDLPGSDSVFDDRVQQLQTLMATQASPWLRAVEQRRVSDTRTLMQLLNRIVAGGGEGLMLHHGQARHVPGRSPVLMKLKPWQDAEAEVIRHLPGEGRLADLMGALLVRTDEGLYFRLGTGFTDAERADPPPVGSRVNYRYTGITPSGLPRFARFVRVRDE